VPTINKSVTTVMEKFSADHGRSTQTSEGETKLVLSIPCKLYDDCPPTPDIHINDAFAHTYEKEGHVENEESNENLQLDQIEWDRAQNLDGPASLASQEQDGSHNLPVEDSNQRVEAHSTTVRPEGFSRTQETGTTRQSHCMEPEVIIPEAFLVVDRISTRDSAEVVEIPSAEIFVPEKFSLTVFGRKIHVHFLVLGAIL